MYSSDKGLSTEKGRSAPQRSTLSRRRLTSRLQPLHGGLGFGSGAIRERALIIARRASQRSPVQSPSENLGSSVQQLQFTEEKTVVRELEQIPSLLGEEVPSSKEGRTQSPKNQLRHTVHQQQQQAPIKKNDSALQIPAVEQVPSLKSVIAGSKKVVAPSLFQGLMAWFFDALVVVACLVMAFTVSASVPFMTLLSTKFPGLSSYSHLDSVTSSTFGWLLLLCQTIALGSLFLFAVQAFSGFFLAASVGRAIANVRLASYRSPVARACKIALGEVLQWPFAFGLLNAIVSPEHNFLLRSLKWARGSAQN